tara:strand:+ start:215 stop:628 length:414 start_codon:yes stop_codon:yes gene_type:complete
MNKLFSLLSGSIFGFGLTLSSMTNPAKVIGFLDITGNWDPSLMFVMIGAIVISAPIFYLLRNKTKPLFGLNFEIPTIKTLDKQLILGASLFGIGWGMVGFCPGPAIASLALFKPFSIIFVIAMAGGFFMSKFIKFNN